ncbi:hypothetical protein [Saccharopolyspora taberi]|uniref:Uncharacterized protein n=1 Tax=Saccharopolyspora taberi TaxID=60895 RepID=A0ABN3VDV4_9PSEU
MQSDVQRQRAEWEAGLMAGVPESRTWRIPAFADHGEVTITVRLPEVRIVDSAGREIGIAPQQADLIASKLGGISDWLIYGAADRTNP